MRILFHLSWYHIKKEKGRHCSFGFIMMITAMILNCSLILMQHVPPSYDEKFIQLNGANINITTQFDSSANTIEEQLLTRDEIHHVEVSEGVYLNTTIEAFKGTDFGLNVMFYPYEERSINQIQLIQGTLLEKDHGIYLPLYMSKFGEYQVGDDITFNINGTRYTFEILGIVEEMQYGNFSSSSIGVYLPLTEYQSFSETMITNKAQNYAIKTTAGQNHKQLTQALTTWMEDQQLTILQHDYDELRKEARMMISQLLMVILAVFSCMILMIGLCLSNFRMKQTMEEELVHLGVCKAMGMTSRQLILSEILPHIVVTGCFAIMGCACSYAVLPMLSELIMMQAGFSLTLPFDLTSSCLTFLLLVVISGIFVYATAKKLRHLQPIDAIRGISQTKRSLHNDIPMEHTLANLHVLLMMKQMLLNMRQSLLVASVMMIVTYLIAFAGILFYNGIVYPDHFTLSLSEEIPTVMITTKPENTELIAEKLRQRKDVEQVVKYETLHASVDDLQTTMFVSEDFSKQKNDFCYEGRNPVTSEEIAIGSAILAEHEYAINDRITLTYEGIKQEYKITGFLQSVNYQGNVIEISEQGLKRLNKDLDLHTLYVYQSDETAVEAFISEVKQTDHQEIEQIINTVEINETAQDMYQQVFQLAIIMICLVSIGMVLLILYVIMKSLISAKKQEFGILKAIGYTNRQLMIQLSGSLLIPSFLAMISSMIIALFTLPWICDMMFQSMGVYQTQFEYPISMMFLFGILLWMVNVLLLIILSRPIKKISAYALLKD